MLVPSLKHCCGIVWNPAVRSVTDWKKDARSFSPNGSVPRVFGLLYSRIRVNSAPLIIKKAVADTASLKCRFGRKQSRSFLRCLRRISLIFPRNSHHTGKPIPPNIISVIVTRLTSTSLR